VTSNDSSDNRDPAVLRLSWRGVAVVLGLIAIASITTLIVVPGVGQEDVLATVAISLAILAFASQLVIYVAQSIAASSQLAEAGRVNADTRALLVHIESAVTSLNSTLGTQFNMLLEHALGQAVPEALTEASESGGPVDVEALEHSILEKLQNSLMFGFRFPERPRRRQSGEALIGKVRAGDWIEHESFGRGRVSAVEGSGDQMAVVVHFDRREINIRRMLLIYAPITLAELPKNSA
jgi:hypothetical protein